MICYHYIWQRLWISGPGNQFLRGDEIHIRKSKDGVDELEEAFLAMGSVEEPGGVEEEGKGGLALGVVLQEVLGEDLLDRVGVLIVETTVSHGAGSTPAEFTIIDIFCQFDKI